MKLKKGFTAPDFTVTDIDGKEVKLSNYKGKKIIIGFFRNVSCPFCNRRVHKLLLNSEAIRQNGVQLLFFFESSTEKLKSSAFHEGISPWPLISDPEKKTYKTYRVEQSNLKMLKTMFVANPSKAMKETKDFNLPEDKDASKNLIPADFFINEDFKIELAHYGTHLDDHVPMDTLKSFAGIQYLA